MTYEAEVLADDPEVYWRLGELSGTTADDASGNGHTGTYQNAPTLGTAGLSSDGDTAVFFDGTNQGLAGDDAPLGPATLSAFTLECLADIDPSCDGPLIAISDPAAVANDYITLYALGGNIFFEFYDGSTIPTVSVPFTAGAHHIAAVYDGASLRLFDDGALVATATHATGALLAVADCVSVGNYPLGGNPAFAIIDEAAVYLSALSAARIAVHAATAIPTVGAGEGGVDGGSGGDVSDPAESSKVPKTYVGMGFGYGARALVPKWSALSNRLYAAAVVRGRESRLEDFIPGTVTLQLENNDGQLIPSNPASPYLSGGYSDAVLADAPQSFFHLAEPSGTTAIDAIAGNDGTYSDGTPTFGKTPYGTMTDDAVGLGTATTHEAEIDLPTAAFNPGSGAFSVECWVKSLSNLTSGFFNAYLCTFIGGAGTSFMSMFASTAFYSSDVPRLYVIVDSNAVCNPAFPDDHEWHHVVVTFDGVDDWNLYLDGALAENSTFALQAGGLGVSSDSVLGGFSVAGKQLRGYLDEVALYHSELSPTRVAAHYDAGSAAASSLIVPGVPVLVADAFVGRTLMSSPSVYWPFDESTGALYDLVRAARLVVPTGSTGLQSTRLPALAVECPLGRGAEFDGAITALKCARPDMASSGATGRSLVSVVRVDSTGAIATFYGRLSSGGPMFRALALDYTTAAKLRLRIRTTASEESVEVSASTGWHLVVGGYRNGSPAVLRVDGGAPTSSTDAVVGATLKLQKVQIGYESTDDATTGRQFGGVVDELAAFDSFLSSAVADQFSSQHDSRWRPGMVHFRGAVDLQNPYDFILNHKRDALMVARASDVMAQLSNATIPPTGPSSSTAPPVVLYDGDAAGVRIGRIWDALGLPLGWRRFEEGQSLMLGTTWGDNALGLALRVNRSENGALYGVRSGQLRFDGRSRQFLDERMQTPQTTYSDSTDSSGSSAIGFRLSPAPRFGYAQLLRNDVIVRNSSFTTELKSTASIDAYGWGTTDREMLNQSRNDLIEQGRFVLEQYKDPLYAPTEITVGPLDSTVHYRAECFRELRDRISVGVQHPGTTRAFADVTVEKITKTIAKRQQIVTYGLDSADRLGFLNSSELLVLDSTVSGRRLNFGRLGF